ncbi:tetratricopeptide repeat protein [Vulgatibacter incomptus]|uniref:TPR domain protein, putative component of TonB system n=1 Tax=Vulgatibacter incomptus TaxID=1391653 RepID=A0A0K1P9W0_9BACT|nr:tetratricopeptide repeat protein [Vulgatibacter incomptus]AKU90287.1 TPR domain protein, putative component of TonB system [Vulgatibacter incomptus]
MADSTSGTKPSAAELAGLEHSFAVDPTSDAYRPLAEAYLAMGRYMEAMVVGRAGARAHPTSPVPRVILSRVYGEQGREKRALEELDAALEVGGEDVPTLRYGAELRFHCGDAAGARSLLEKALALAPADEAVAELARKNGVELKPPTPAVQTPVVQTPVVQTPAMQTPVVQPAPAAQAPLATQGTPVLQPAAGVQAPQAMQGAPVLQPAAAVQAPATQGAPVLHPAQGGAPIPVFPNANGGQPASQPAEATSYAGRAAAAPATDHGRTPATKPAARAALDPSAWDTDDDDVAPRRGSGRQFLTLVVSVALVIAGLGGWHFLTKMREAREREIAKLLEETNEQLRKDTYASYKAASASADRILELEGSNYVAHAYLAYINALRWGEQGDGDDFKRRASEELAAAKKAGESHGRIVAAEAYIKFFDGDPKGAEEAIGKVLESGQRSGLLYTTLGTIQMWAGELDNAAASLKQAQAVEPNSVRVLAALGQLNRRRSMDTDAWTFYDSALRIDRDHADSLLGKALLVLDANEIDRPKSDQEKLLREAESQIDKVLHLPDGSISARQLALAKFARAQLLFAHDQADEAARLEREAFTLDPGNPDIRLMKGRRLLREKNVDEAVAEIRRAIEIEPRRASFYVDLSRALLAKPGGAKEAVTALEKALATFPDSGRIHVLLGDANRAVPSIDAARKAYERAIEVESGKMPEARAKLGAIWREKKEYAKAREELEKALKELGLAATGPTLALALTELGRTYDEEPNRDVQQAFERYAKAISASESYAPPYFLIGRISAGQRDREQQKQAIESLESYIRLAPKGEFAEEARSLLARLR